MKLVIVIRNFYICQMSFQIGDVVHYKNVAIEGNYKVVDVFPSEPAMLLVTDPEGDEGNPKTNFVLQADCVLVERPGEVFHKRTYPKQPKAAQKPAEYPIGRDFEC